ncbi:MAG: restriction endonuclease subunit S [Bacteroidales bacterium]|nr:restriction endonuclease subunit S [Bacteroidales bacterium]
MKINLETYPTYKPSGVEWLGEIPEHWEVSRLKNHIDLITGYPFKSEKYTTEGIKLARGINVKEGVFNWDETRYWPALEKHLEDFLLETNDILIGMDGSKVGKNFCKVKESDLPILLLQRVARLRANGSLKSDFLFYNFLNKNFLIWVEMSKTDPMVPHIAPTDIHDFIIPIPPLSEQTAIAAFLDRKTALIEQAIGIKQKQIELLKERRQILIHKAVTRGIGSLSGVETPNVKLKESGVEWIGEIPEGWEVKRLKTLLQEGRDGIRIGPFGSSIKSEILKPKGFKIYGQEHVIADDFSIGEKYIDENDFMRLSNYELFAGDIVITMMGTTGKSKVVPNSIERGIMDSHLIRVRTKNNQAKPEFVSFLINDSEYIFDQIKLRGKGSIMEGLNSSIVKSLHLLLPPLNEQKSILLYIDEINSKFKITISLKEQEIEKLKEYKATLINSAVTGKIKVDNDDK